jgi:hypothetical protein
MSDKTKVSPEEMAKRLESIKEALNRLAEEIAAFLKAAKD